MDFELEHITPADGTRSTRVHLRPASQNPRDRIFGMVEYCEGAMKAGLRNFMFGPWSVVLGAAAGWTTGYFVTWEMTVLARCRFGTIAAAAALVLWALKGVYTEPKANGTKPIAGND